MMRHDQNPGWLGYIRDYTTQFYRDYSEPLYWSLLTNQYNGMKKGFERCSNGLFFIIDVHSGKLTLS